MAELQAVRVSDHHQLTMLGGEDGQIEYWDPRVRKCIGRLDVSSEVMRQFAEYVVPRLVGVTPRGRVG